MSEITFDLAGYRCLLAALVGHGYTCRDYDAVVPERADLLLRHDIDMSISAARRIAECEAEAEMFGHYFVLLRTEFYNPLSAAGLEDLRAIAAAGHRIGLHYDASLYPQDYDSLSRGAEWECGLLEQGLGQAVTTISFHRPSRALLGSAMPLAGRLHSYMPRFFSDIGYCSDSQGCWRFGAPLDHDAVRQGRAIQLLTHPIWWTASAELSVVEKLENFALSRYEATRVALGENCTPFQSHQQLQGGLGVRLEKRRGASE